MRFKAVEEVTGFSKGRVDIEIVEGELVFYDKEGEQWEIPLEDYRYIKFPGFLTMNHFLVMPVLASTYHLKGRRRDLRAIREHVEAARAMLEPEYLPQRRSRATGFLVGGAALDAAGTGSLVAGIILGRETGAILIAVGVLACVAGLGLVLKGAMEKGRIAKAAKRVEGWDSEPEGAG